MVVGITQNKTWLWGCSITYHVSNHVTNVHLPLILMDVLVCCGLKMVLFRYIYMTLTTSNNPLTVLQLVEELETFISFSLSSAAIIYDLVTYDRFPSAQTCEEGQGFYTDVLFSRYCMEGLQPLF